MQQSSGRDTFDIVAESRQWVHARAREELQPGIGEAAEAVQGVVSELAAEPLLNAAALLRPAVRAGLISRAQIARRLGDDVANFCAQLERLDELTVRRDWTDPDAVTTDQAEALRRMLLALVNDVRLILIRLAEVLYELRLAKQADDDDRRRLALEAQALYAPLANRLGVWQLKWELEDLSFRYLEPERYQEIASFLKSRRSEREAYLNRVKRALGDELDKAGIRHAISARPKHIYSIHRKMQRKGSRIDELYDLKAIRVLVDDVHDCYGALGVVHNLWSYLPQEFDDYIANPKPNLYRSLHTAVIGPDGDPLEVQIRTHEMHRHAELGVAAHWRYKEGGDAQPAFEQKIRWLRELLEPGGQSERGEGEFLDRVREEILDDRVYAISPKGDIVDLPAGATPLDFAYQVHTEIGHRCRGAKVNGRIVTLTYQVQNGDQIEIITGREPAPSRDWLVPRLGFLKSTRSRTKVRSWFRAQDREQNKRQGREMLERELQRLNERDRPLADVAAQLKFDSVDSLSVALGAGDITTASIASALQQMLTPDETPRKRRRQRVETASADESTVTGIGDLMSQFARCCRPLPPEPIGGYITQGRGVTIHRRDCGNFLRLAEREPRRILDVAWGSNRAERYTTAIRVEAQDRNGLLRDVSAVLSDEDIGILDSRTRIDRREQRALFDMTVSVDDLETLSRALNRINSLPGVSESRRTG